MYPVVDMLTGVPTFALANVNVGVPVKVTTSGEITPLNAAVPVAVAAVVLSYALLLPVNPVTVNAFVLTVTSTVIVIEI